MWRSAKARQLTAHIGQASLHIGPSAGVPVDAATQLQIDAALQAMLGGSSKTLNFAGVSADDSDNNDCGLTGSVDYLPQDAANGNRATGVDACLTEARLKMGSKARQADVPGYQWGQDYAKTLGVDNAKFSINACHLLGKQLGGRGELANEATCGRSTNAARQDKTDPGRDDPMVNFENLVKTEVNAGYIVHYHVRPEYVGNRTVPYAFLMDATSSTGETALSVVPNVVYSPTQQKWVNIGNSACTSCTNPIPVAGVK
jgi:hypothetical protein